jgi:hypothetical protein
MQAAAAVATLVRLERSEARGLIGPVAGFLTSLPFKAAFKADGSLLQSGGRYWPSNCIFASRA